MSIEGLASSIVGITALFLLLVGVIGLSKPTFAKSFFTGFATNPFKHYLEIAVRIVVGLAFIVHSGQSLAPKTLNVLGWVLIITSLVLALIPWRWHKTFAAKSVASAMRYLVLLSIASIVMGAALFWFAFSSVL
jgi:hypothetical protein